MIGGLGIWELVLILIIVLLIFGPNKLGDIGSALGKGVSGFKKAIQNKDLEKSDKNPEEIDKDLEESDKNLEKADKNNSSKKR